MPDTEVNLFSLFLPAYLNRWILSCLSPHDRLCWKLLSQVGAMLNTVCKQRGVALTNQTWLTALREHPVSSFIPAHGVTNPGLAHWDLWASTIWPLLLPRVSISVTPPGRISLDQQEPADKLGWIKGSAGILLHHSYRCVHVCVPSATLWRTEPPWRPTVWWSSQLWKQCESTFSQPIGSTGGTHRCLDL